MMEYEAYGITDIIMAILVCPLLLYSLYLRFCDFLILFLFLLLVAMAVSLALFLYPLPTFCRIWSQQSSQELQPYPYLAMDMAFWVWMAYAGPIHGTPYQFHHYCLLTVSQLGVAFQLVYIRYFCHFTTPDKAFIMYCAGFGEFLFFLIIPYLMGCRSASLFSPEKTKVLGPASVFFGLMMYASPSLTIIDAYQTRRIDLLPFGFCIFFCLNAIVWFSYACLYPPTFDSYIAIANGGGIVLVVIQLTLCYIFRVKLQDLGATEDSTPLLHETP